MKYILFWFRLLLVLEMCRGPVRWVYGYRVIRTKADAEAWAEWALEPLTAVNPTP